MKMDGCVICGCDNNQCDKDSGACKDTINCKSGYCKETATNACVNCGVNCKHVLLQVLVVNVMLDSMEAHVLNALLIVLIASQILLIAKKKFEKLYLIYLMILRMVVVLPQMLIVNLDITIKIAKKDVL